MCSNYPKSALALYNAVQKNTTNQSNKSSNGEDKAALSDMAQGVLR